MRKTLCLFGIFFFLTVNAGIYAADPPSTEIPPSLRYRAIVMDINTRVVERNQMVVWNETNQRITISGSPVNVRLVGANVAIALQVTPFIRRQGNVLVAHGQIFIEVPNEGIRYHTSIQTIPMNFGEPIYFFPLGPASQDSAAIEIALTLRPYSTETPASSRTGNGR
jgi:hypothetical protein